MISYEQAYAMMLEAAAVLDTETVPLADACGRVLAGDVHSDLDMPPFDKAAMDGYACRREDLDRELTVVEEIPAGALPRQTVGPGTCAKIMTGAPVPAGADVVIMQEYVEVTGERRIRFTGKSSGDNICPRGEDLRTGALVLAKGLVVTPARVALLATVGCSAPLVYRQPRVGVIATGDELVEAEETPSGARIRNSNSPQLCVQLAAMAVPPTYYGIVPDRYEDTVAAVAAAKAENDVVLLSGGVSTGEYDLVPDALTACGFSLFFDSVAMKPGRPTVFGRDGQVYCCGLPGNPVATFVIFERLLKPFLYRLMGHDFQPRVLPMALEKAVSRRKAERQSVIPVAFSGPGRVTPLEYHGSAHIGAMSEADGLLVVPVGVANIETGSEVHVRLL